MRCGVILIVIGELRRHIFFFSPASRTLGLRRAKKDMQQKMAGATDDKANTKTGATGVPKSLVEALALLLACQLAGEFIVQAIGAFAPAVAFPGPVVGMALLFGLLAWRKGAGGALGTTADGILANLSLLFVPAAVGIVQYGPVLMENGLALIAALIVSTVLTLIVTVLTFIAVARHLDKKAETGDAS